MSSPSNPPVTTQKSLTKIFWRAARWLVYPLVVLLLVVGVALTWISVRLDDFRPQIESQLTTLLNSPVNIGRLELSWDLWRPRLDLLQLEIAQKNVLEPKAVVIAKAHGIVSWRSLAARLPLFDAFELADGRLIITRRADGHIYLANYQLDTGSKESTGLGPKIFFQLSHVALRNAQLIWQDETQSPATTAQVMVDDALMSNGLLSHRLTAQVRLFAQKNALKESLQPLLGLDIDADFVPTENGAQRYQIATWQGVTQLKVNALQLQQVPTTLSMVATLLPPALKETLQQQQKALQGLAGTLQLKVKARVEQLKLKHIGASLQVNALQLPVTTTVFTPASTLDFDQLALNAQWDATTQTSVLDRFSLTRQGKRVDLEKVEVTQQSDSGLAIKLAPIQISPLAVFAQTLPWRSDLYKLIAPITVVGQLTATQIQRDPLGGLSYSSGLKEVTVQGLGQNTDQLILDKLNGVVNGTVNGDLSQHNWNLRWDQLGLDSARFEPKKVLLRAGKTRGNARQIKKEWQVAVQQLTAQLDQSRLDISGNYRINPRSDHLNARLSIDSMPLGRIYQLLPVNLTGPRSWLKGGLARGRLKNLQLVFDSSLKNLQLNNSQNPAIRVESQLEDAWVNYLPDAKFKHAGEAAWPLLFVPRAQLQLRNLDLSIQARAARTLDLNVPAIDFRMGPLNAPTISVATSAAGATQSFLDYVRYSPIAELIGPAAATLQQTKTKGKAEVALNLRIPLVNIEQLEVKTGLRFYQNTLTPPAPYPAIDQLNGRIEFALSQGVTVNTDNLQFNALGGTHKVNAQVEPSRQTTQIETTGQVAIDELRSFAPQLPLWQALSGKIPYALSATLNKNEIVARLHSDLIGLGSQLPAPFAKNTQDTLPIELALKKNDALSVNLNVERALQIKADAKNLTASRLLGDGLVTNITVPRFYWQEWAPLFTTEKKAPTQTNEPLQINPQWFYPNPKFALKQLTVKVDQGQVVGFDLSQADLKLNADEQRNRWDLALDSVPARLKASWQAAPTLAQSRFLLDVDHLRIPAPEKSPVSDEKTTTDNPPQSAARPMLALPQIDAVIRDLKVWDKPLGHLKLTGGDPRDLPLDSPAQWQLKQLSLTNAYLQSEITGGWNAQSSDFKGSLASSNVGALLELLGLKNIAEKGTAQVDFMGQWSGYPTAFELSKVKAQASIDTKEGKVAAVSLGPWRFLSVLSAQSYLNLNDALSKSIAYDRVQADLTLSQGQVRSQNAQVKSVFANATATAEIDLLNKTLLTQVKINPKVDALGVSYLLGAFVNPIVGAATALAQVVALSTASTWLPTVQVAGPFTAPKVELK